ncbi:hypothetical protein MJO55_21430 [Mycolicibacterium rufum]|uniref:Uncharacterized protein n=1 Tax=Mycolicibacterium rufum TaxID=318424 RepID=A0A9X2YD31_9MYCO|nr:hypothetical protein [Mycolicibacterium rufum]KGI69563.1 hypothetical protein EU78_21370 [Mycolicibacterium rufum]MCV7071789.1 hypothetical protein [Mycolicibacterium rufum]ULP35789.1 hypothetical protein MJO55_21430 [Mycolicibacterium rufum]
MSKRTTGDVFRRTAVVAGVSAVGALVWSSRRRSAGGRHEMPDLPGAHEDGTFHVTPDGRLQPD